MTVKQLITVDLRGKLANVIWETDFIRRDHTEEIISRAGCIPIAVYMAVITWCCYEASDMCLYEKSVPVISRRLKLTHEEVTESITLLACRDIDLLDYDFEGKRWWSRRLFKEVIKLLRKQSNAKSADAVERFLAALGGNQRELADTNGYQRTLAGAGGLE